MSHFTRDKIDAIKINYVLFDKKRRHSLEVAILKKNKSKQDLEFTLE